MAKVFPGARFPPPAVGQSQAGTPGKPDVGANNPFMKSVLQPNFPRALRYASRARGKSQESLDVVSGRTYVSALERGLKQPTIDKVAEFANALGLHPLTLDSLAYSDAPTHQELRKLFDQPRDELDELQIQHRDA